MTPWLQTSIVAAIVAACLVYAVWTLMPAAMRRRAATLLLALPWPTAIEKRLRGATRASGCGCDNGCGQPPPVAAQQPLTFHPRPKRR